MFDAFFGHLTCLTLGQNRKNITKSFVRAEGRSVQFSQIRHVLHIREVDEHFYPYKGSGSALDIYLSFDPSA
jgi:hypothetical protein